MVSNKTYTTQICMPYNTQKLINRVVIEIFRPKFQDMLRIIRRTCSPSFDHNYYKFLNDLILTIEILLS